MFPALTNPLRATVNIHPALAQKPDQRLSVRARKIHGQARLVGQGERHVNFMVRQGPGGAMRVIAFSMAERLDELMSQNGQCCLVYTPKINEWQGMTRVDLEVLDFQPGPTARFE